MMRSLASFQKRTFRRQRKRWRNFLLGTTAVIFVGFIVFLLFFSDIFVIKNIKISESRFVDTVQLSNSIVQFLSHSKILGLLNIRNNLLFLNRNSLRNLIFQYSAIGDFDISKNFKNREVSVFLKERLINGILCQENPVITCYYFDTDGTVFATAPQSEGNLIFLIKDSSGRLYSLGDKILASELFNELLKIKNLVAERFKLDFIRIGKDDLEFKIVNGSFIYLNPSDLFRSFLAIQNLLNSDFNFKNLEYLDLRYLPNIYYKYH